MTAYDLIEACLALERIQLLEHALIVARALHAVHHQFLAAHAQPVHLHGAVHDRKQQRRGHDGETNQHQSTQGFGPGHTHAAHSSSESCFNERLRSCVESAHER